MDRIETAYGFVDRAALLQARESFDMPGLLRCIEELKEAADARDSERGLRDSFMRLYCMMATILFGAFLAYALIDLLSATQRHAVKSFEPVKKQDYIALGSGIVLALLFMTFHRLIIGVKVVPWGV